jgi:hypothetical protein
MPRRKFTTTLDADLLHQLKIRAAQENTDVSKILERLIADYLHHDAPSSL